MELKLVKEDNQILRNKAEPWNFDVDQDLELLVKEMAMIMFQYRGIGLAAPQVGVSKRLFIMGNSDKLIACVNPEIISGEGLLNDTEGCLSFPNLWLHVKRNEKVHVKYQDIKGNVIEEQLTGLMARVFQHEYEHLEGVCFDTKVPKLSLKMAKKRRERLK